MGDDFLLRDAGVLIISIHALREEGDTTKLEIDSRDISISIHALREEGDRQRLSKTSCILYFYPRPPRGGRHGEPGAGVVQCGISIHALREEGDLWPSCAFTTAIISIHALREEGDCSA